MCHNGFTIKNEFFKYEIQGGGGGGPLLKNGVEPP